MLFGRPMVQSEITGEIRRPTDPGRAGVPLLRASEVSVKFGTADGGDQLLAVDSVNLDLVAGDSLGIVGETGSGKTTLARCLLGLLAPSSGTVAYEGQDLRLLSRGAWRRLRHSAQMVFQEPVNALDPRMRVRDLIAEPLRAAGHPDGNDRSKRISEVLAIVGLGERFLDRFPHQLSGGQLQRVGIARALAVRPGLMVFDEPTSSVDWLVRAEILRLLQRLRLDLGLTYIVISHDLTTIRQITDRVLVMYMGQIIESAVTPRLFAKPEHPYTRALLSAHLDPRGNVSHHRLHLRTEDESARRGSGCKLFGRCPISIPACRDTVQRLESVGDLHAVACMRVTSEEGIEWPALAP